MSICSRPRAVFTGLALALAAGCGGGSADPTDATAADAPVDVPAPSCTPAAAWPRLTSAPAALADTGLYAADGTLAGEVRPFTPRFPLWSDGAEKDRFVYLPGCDAIDAADPDAWQLPVGTRLWKHFRVGGRLIETRLLARTGPGDDDWLFAAYAWNDAATAAVRVDDGVIDALGTGHDIPPAAACLTCHGATPGRALGFAAIQLSHDGPGVTIATLVDETRLPPAMRAGFDPPGDATAVAALGTLHANCGTCHNDTAGTPLRLRLHTGDTEVEGTAAWTTAVGVPALFVVAGHPLRIAPGDADASLVPYRMGERGNQRQMPPLASELVDDAGLTAVRAWIDSLPPDAGAVDAGMIDAPAIDGGGGGCTNLGLAPVASGLSTPVYVTSEPGDANRLYVVEKDGRVRLVVNGVVRPAPFLDLRAGGAHPLVYIPGAAAEGGLLGMVFDPDYATTGRFWLHYTAAPGGRVTVGEFRRSADPDLASTVATDLPRRKLVDAAHGGWNHCGGMLAFGPGGYLFASIGDGASSPSPARTLADVRGKILRIDVDSGAGPAGNQQGLVWDDGLRNPWRFSFDRADGTMYVGDVGQNQWEELDIAPPGSGPHDYGWPVMEGTHCMTAGCTPVGTAPAVEHAHDEASSIIGGFVYRGAALPCLTGWYVYGDYGSTRFWALRWNGSAVAERRDITADLGLPAGEHPVSFGEDAAGELYVVTIEGNLFRITGS